MREAVVRNVTHLQASQLLHNKFVVVLGDSIQRSVYKDLVLLLQRDSYLTLSQLKSKLVEQCFGTDHVLNLEDCLLITRSVNSCFKKISYKGELSFEEDSLIEGGRLGHMTNGTEYREVRQYRTDHHLVRFYFITRVFSRYMESILADFKRDLKPDVVIVNSCVWDVSRYNRRWVSEYKENLHKFFAELKAILPEESLVLWNMTMPLGKKIIGGFLVPEIEYMGPTLRFDIIEANFYGAMLANAYSMDVLDLHFMFRFSLHHRMRDGVHWNSVAHRQITCLLLAHAAQAWGVELPSPTDQKKCLLDCTQTSYQSMNRTSGYYGAPVWQQYQQYDGYKPDFYKDGLATLPQFCNGYFSFPKNTAHNGGRRNALPSSSVRPVSAGPSYSANNYVMRQRHTKRHYNPYTRQNPSRYNHYKY